MTERELDQLKPMRTKLTRKEARANERAKNKAAKRQGRKPNNHV